MDDLIRRLSEIRSQYNCFDEAERQYYHALSEAIRELSGRADGDTIYRQDAIDAAKDWYEGLICGSFRGLEKRLKSLPSAQPQRKTGKWIEDEDEMRVICSKCGEPNYSISDFCPNCGVDMRGE